MPPYASYSLFSSATGWGADKGDQREERVRSSDVSSIAGRLPRIAWRDDDPVRAANPARAGTQTAFSDRMRCSIETSGY